MATLVCMMMCGGGDLGMDGLSVLKCCRVYRSLGQMNGYMWSVCVLVLWALNDMSAGVLCLRIVICFWVKPASSSTARHCGLRMNMCCMPVHKRTHANFIMLYVAMRVVRTCVAFECRRDRNIYSSELVSCVWPIWKWMCNNRENPRVLT